MILQSLEESHAKGQLILIDGGFCRYHIRKDGILVIYEIFSTTKGAGKKMLDMLYWKPCIGILARCPQHYESNTWYQKQGFVLRNSVDKGKYVLNEWYKENT